MPQNDTVNVVLTSVDPDLVLRTIAIVRRVRHLITGEPASLLWGRDVVYTVAGMEDRIIDREGHTRPERPVIVENVTRGQAEAVAMALLSAGASVTFE
jgi:hypothetical protein